VGSPAGEDEEAGCPAEFQIFMRGKLLLVLSFLIRVFFLRHCFTQLSNVLHHTLFGLQR